MALIKPKLIALTSVHNDNLKSLGVQTPEDLVAYCARVSNPKNQANSATAAKLLKYLQQHKHWSPFEMVNLVFEITTTRDIARQILRHRSFSFQEFSQRYASVDQLPEPEFREMRLQDAKNRQSSIDNFSDAGLTESEWLAKARAWYAIQDEVIKTAESAYKEAIQLGIAKEQARAVLPEGLTTSVLYANGTLRSWLHWCQVRNGLDTQKEHRLLALDIQSQIVNLFTSLEV